METIIIIIKEIFPFLTKAYDKLLKKPTEKNHYLTPPPSIADTNNVIGRDKVLKSLWKTLKKRKTHKKGKAVIISGFGGIGKTKLAQLLFHTYESKFDEVAWIDYRSDLRKSFLACINVPQFQEKNYQDENERWNDIKRILTNDRKKKLFIIDNVDNDTDQHPEQDIELQELTGWNNTTVLLTSRLERLKNYNQFSLGFLEKEKCIKVFKHYYDSEASNPEIIAKIVELANMHTLTVELLAKGARRENLEKYYNKLIENGFQAVDREMIIDHHKGNETIEQHLRLLFDMQGLSEKDKQILNSFAILPVNCECEIEEIEQWFGFTNRDLDKVIQDGWLRYNINGKYSLHSLVRTIVRFDFKKNTAPKNIVGKILDYFVNHAELFDIDKGYNTLHRIILIVESVLSSVAQEESECIARVYHKLGSSYHNMGDNDKALEYHFKAQLIYENVLGTEHPLTAQSFNNIGTVYDDQGNYDKALEYYLKALKIQEKVLGMEHTDTATSSNNIGVVYWEQSNYEEALTYFFKALAIREKVLGSDHPCTAISCGCIGLVYDHQGNYNKALEYFLKAMKIQEKVLGVEHPDTAKSYDDIGLVYKKQGDYDKALKYFLKTLTIRKKVLGMEHPDTIKSYNNIGMIFEKKGEYRKALEYHHKVAATSGKVLGTKHPTAASSYNNINVACDDQGDYEKTLEKSLKALAIREKLLGTEHARTALYYNNIGMMCRDHGDYRTALEYYRKALAIYEKVLGSEHHNTKTILKNIKETNKALGSNNQSKRGFFRRLFGTGCFASP